MLEINSYYIELTKNIRGNILDIGGGGEGIIGRIYPERTISIDIRKEELEEAPEGPIKIVMDAKNMSFMDNCFDNVAAFYSFMFMDKIDYLKVLMEIKRVLKYNGYLYIWEPEIPVINENNLFKTELKINADGTIINTTYGIIKRDAFQDSDYFKKIISDIGFELVQEYDYNHHFFQCWENVK